MGNLPCSARFSSLAVAVGLGAAMAAGQGAALAAPVASDGAGSSASSTESGGADGSGDPTNTSDSLGTTSEGSDDTDAHETTVTSGSGGSTSTSTSTDTGAGTTPGDEGDSSSSTTQVTSSGTTNADGTVESGVVVSTGGAHTSGTTSDDTTDNNAKTETDDTDTATTGNTETTTAPDTETSTVGHTETSTAPVQKFNADLETENAAPESTLEADSTLTFATTSDDLSPSDFSTSNTALTEIAPERSLEPEASTAVSSDDQLLTTLVLAAPDDTTDTGDTNDIDTNDGSVSIGVDTTADIDDTTTTSRLTNVIGGLVSWVGLAPAAATTDAPVQPVTPPTLWAVLAWIRREIQRTFFNSSPRLVYDPTTAQQFDNGTITGTVTARDRNGDPVTYSVSNGIKGGRVTIDEETGEFNYVPSDELAVNGGKDWFAVTATEDVDYLHLHRPIDYLRALFTGTSVHSVTKIIRINVTPVENQLTAVDDRFEIAEDTDLRLRAADLLANDTGRDQASWSIASIDDTATVGTVTLTGQNIDYRPALNYSGLDSFDYVVTDGTRTSTATVRFNVNPLADTPDLSVNDAIGDEDAAIALDIGADLTDTDGSETLAITIIGVPTGAALSKGTNNGDGTWTLTRDELAGLTITPAPNDDTAIDLAIRAVATDGTSTAVRELPLTVTVNALADVPGLSVFDAIGDEDTAIPLRIGADLTDTDGSEALAITIIGVPTGAALSKGTNNGDGTWTLTRDELAGLTITPAPNDDTAIDLAIRAVATDGTSTAVRELPLTVTVNALADLPDLTVIDAIGDEDTAIPLRIGADLTDTDGSETLAITIIGVPTGAALSKGTNNGDGTWTLTRDELAGLTITPAPNDDTAIDLAIRAVATEASGVTAARELPLTVTVNPINDAAVTDEVSDPEVDIRTGVVTGTVRVSDIDGDELTVDIDVDPTVGRLVDLSLTGTPGVYGYTIQLTDAARMSAFVSGATVTAPLSVSVTDNIADVATETTVDAPISAASLAVVDSFDIGANRGPAAINAAGDTLYVVTGNTTVSVIDLADPDATPHALTVDTDFDSPITDLAVGPYGSLIYVTTTSGDLYAVTDDGTTTTTTKITLRSGGFPVTNYDANAVTTGIDGTTLYVANGRELIAVDTTNSYAVTDLRVDVGFTVSDLAVSPDGDTLYAVNVGARKLAAVNLTANSVVYSTTLDVNPGGVAASADSTLVYLANDDGTIAIIDMRDPGIPVELTSVTIGSSLGGITTSADGTVYVTDTAGTVTALTVLGGPITVADTYTVTEDLSLSATSSDGLLANDYDTEGLELAVNSVNGRDDVLGITIHTDAGGALIVGADGRFTYEPLEGSVGVDTFTYTTYDGVNTSNSSIVTITVIERDDAPVTAADTYTVASSFPALSTSLANGLLANDYDPEALQLTVNTVNGRDDVIGVMIYTDAGNALNVKADGTFSWGAVDGFVGTDTFTYTAYDGVNTSAPTTVTITVTDEATPIVTLTGSGRTGDDGVATWTVTATGTNGSAIADVSVSQPGQASATAQYLNGEIVYTIDTEYVHQLSAVPNGVVPTAVFDILNVTVTDANGASATQTLIVSIDPINTAATVSVDGQGISADGTVYEYYLTLDDLDGDDLTVYLPPTSGSDPATTQPLYGVITYYGDGSGGVLVYDGSAIAPTLDPDTTVTDEFTIVVGDGHGGTTTLTFYPTVYGPQLIDLHM